MAFGAGLTRVEVGTVAEDGPHQLAVAFVPGQPKRMTVDGNPVDRLFDAPGRPLVSVFLPDRLELIKGAPALRRAHLDQFVSAMWPARTTTRRAYAQALAQRNALIARIRTGRGGTQLLDPWDRQLAEHGWALMADRRQAVDALAPWFAQHARGLGLDGDLELRYRPRSKGDGVGGAPCRARRTSAGPTLSAGSADTARTATSSSACGTAATCGSTAPRASSGWACSASCSPSATCWPAARDAPPLLLLDDVMSELDAVRRLALVDAAPDRRRSGAHHLDRSRPRPGRTRCGGGSARRLRRPGAPGCGGGMSPYRRSPRRLAMALETSQTTWEPETLLAAAQAAWPEVVGAMIAAESSPVRERNRVLTIGLFGRGLGPGDRVARPDDPASPERGSRRRLAVAHPVHLDAATDASHFRHICRQFSSLRGGVPGDPCAIVMTTISRCPGRADPGVHRGFSMYRRIVGHRSRCPWARTATE